MNKQRWTDLLEECDNISRKSDILAAKDDLACMCKAILIAIAPLIETENQSAKYSEIITWIPVEIALPDGQDLYMTIDKDGVVETQVSYDARMKEIYKSHPNHPQNEVRSGWYTYPEGDTGEDWWEDSPVAWAKQPKGPKEFWK